MLLAKIALVIMVLALLSCSIADSNTGSADQESRAALDAWLKTLSKDKPLPSAPKIAAVDGAVAALFPEDRFFTVQFMRFPRAVTPPVSLQLENLVRVQADGSVDRIENVEALPKLFEKKLADVRDEHQARIVLMTCLRLAEEFYQDGYYTFNIPEASVSAVRQDQHWIAAGIAVVTQGGKGEISVMVTTGSPGKITINGKVWPNVRLR